MGVFLISYSEVIQSFSQSSVSVSWLIHHVSVRNCVILFCVGVSGFADSSNALVALQADVR